jgi:hypothetical protein
VRQSLRCERWDDILFKSHMALKRLLKSLTSALSGQATSNEAPPASRSGPVAVREAASATWTDDHGIDRSVTDVFISYSRSDREKVLRIVEQLNAEGLTVFWDADVPAGQSYTDFLRRALDFSRLVLVVWSQQSVTSDWVMAEAEYARAHRRLVSCRIEQCTPSPPFNTFQTADLSDWEGDAGAPSWRQVVNLISHRVRNGDAKTVLGEVINAEMFRDRRP